MQANHENYWPNGESNHSHVLWLGLISQLLNNSKITLADSKRVAHKNSTTLIVWRHK